MQTSAAIGDDRLQRQAQGYVVPDAFTHGSSEQRQKWFMVGYRQASVDACNTFSTFTGPQYSSASSTAYAAASIWSRARCDYGGPNSLNW